MRRYRWILGLPWSWGRFFPLASGGGSSSAPVVLGKSVYWAAPQYFTDNTPLIPSRDLQGYRDLRQAGFCLRTGRQRRRDPVAPGYLVQSWEYQSSSVEGDDILRFDAYGHRGGHEIRFFPPVCFLPLISIALPFCVSRPPHPRESVNIGCRYIHPRMRTMVEWSRIGDHADPV